MIVIRFRYYSQKQCFEGHRQFNNTLKTYSENIIVKTLVSKVKTILAHHWKTQLPTVTPLWYYRQKQCIERQRQLNNTLKTQSESTALPVIPYWYYWQRQCFERHRQFNKTMKNHFENISVKTFISKVIPFWYIFEKHCFWQ